MKNLLFLTCVLVFVICSSDLRAQVCSDGTTPETITFTFNGQQTFDLFGDPDNLTETLCFPAGTTVDVVGAEWSGIDITPVGLSFCDEAAIDIAGAIAFNPAFGEANGGPCSNNYSSNGILDFDQAGLIFTTGTDGCVTIEFYEDFDDNPDAVDASFDAGSLTLYACAVGETLPIELAHFVAEPMKLGNKIAWSTASEVQNDYQMIQKSYDGISGWSEVGRVASEGDSRELREYELMDRSPYKTTYYRVYSVDLDGQVQISEAISVTRELSKSLTLYPNPATDHTVLSISTTNDGLATISIVDFTGKIVREVPQTMIAGQKEIALDVSDLQSGVYSVVYHSESASTVERMIVR